MNKSTVDVCIVGGGIVGTALAAALSASAFGGALRIALVDAGDVFAAPAPGLSNRVSAVTPQSQALLARLGAWERLGLRRKPFAQMKVWDAAGRGRLAFSAPQTHAAARIGTIVENARLRRALADSLGDAVAVHGNALVESVEAAAASGWPRVNLKGGAQIEARLLIGADGANSLVRKYAGINSTGWDYPQKALVATLELENVEGNGNDVAYQRFLPEGPIALLPLTETVSSMVWSTSPTTAAKLSKLSSKDFASFVNIAFRNPIEDLKYFTDLIQPDGSLPSTLNLEEEAAWGRSRLETANFPNIGTPPSNTTIPTIRNVVEGSRAGFPLRFYLSERYVSESRVALIGDAAHTIHPLAGQGLNLGLLDVDTLSRVIEEAVLSGSDIGNIHSLQKYASERFTPNLGMMLAVDAVGKLFRAESDPVVWARSFGMNLVNTIPGFKELAMKAASSIQ
ncbi:hypothetical protein BDR26DRAFT_911612 [Obelidium mucronatum]|nr:hypothetical protein BDR26DRAFT_911612 [Obelidium mucronatum]